MMVRSAAPASNVEWKRWGEVDPLYAVATWKEKRRGGPDPWTDEAFYRLGESDWGDFLARWEQYGLSRESCVEIGCGAGRITMHLSRTFGTTHAVDVSEAMIAYARARIGGAVVTFHCTDGMTIPLPDRSVAAAFSTHVFQHFDSLAYATACFTEIERVLVPGGTMMIHVPIYRWPAMTRVFDRLYWIRNRILDAHAWVRRRLIERGLSRPIMRRLSYPVSFLFETLPELGLTGVEIAIIATKSSNTQHPFVLARKGRFRTETA